MWTNFRPQFVHKNMSGAKNKIKLLNLRGVNSLFFKPNFYTTGAGNNPMVGMTVACAVAIEEAMKA